MEEYLYHVGGSDEKKTVYSGLPEFGYELIATLPYAYYLSLRGELESTISGFDTSCLYWFSPKHVEREGGRSWDNAANLMRSGFPNINIHRNRLDWSIFVPPPLKQHYLPERITFSKPTVVIANRKSIEWEGEPINFIDRKTLHKLVEMLRNEYQIVYLDPAQFGKAYEDHLKFIDTEVEIPDEVLTIGKLRQLYPRLSLNELQCKLFAGCERFISSNGGLGIFCSYFGGENIIFTKMCQELDVEINSFHSWYYRLSGAVIAVSRNEDNLIKLVADKWVKRRPLIHVLIETRNRPNCFHDCIKSVEDQNYLNSHLIVSVADGDSEAYVRKHPCSMVEMIDSTTSGPLGIRTEMAPMIQTGYMIHLDETTVFRDATALETIATVIEKTNETTISWRHLEDEPSQAEGSSDSDVLYSGELFGRNCHMAVVLKSDQNNVPVKHLNRSVPGGAGVLNADFRLVEPITRKQINCRDSIEYNADKQKIDVSQYMHVSIVVVAFDIGEPLQRCLDSILNNKDVPEFRVLVAVDEKRETWLATKKMTRRYGGKVEFYFSNRRLKSNTIKNSILKKIYRRDTLVFFLDSDCVLPPNAISGYVSKYNTLYQNKDFNGILKVQMSDDAFLKLDRTRSAWWRDEARRDLFICNYGALERVDFFPLECSESDSDFYRRLDNEGIRICDDRDVPRIGRLVYRDMSSDKGKIPPETSPDRTLTPERGTEGKMTESKGLTEPVTLRPIL